MIRYSFDGHQGRLVMEDATGQEQGFLSFVLESEGIADAQHTVVAPAYQGQGVAAALAKELFVLAQEQGWRVRPSCSYIARYMERHPELPQV